jgi:hypothetical protein
MKKIIAMLCLFTSFFSRAQEKMCDTNSCIKKKAGDYQVELVKQCSDRLDIYVNDSKDKPLIDTAIIGYVEFFFNDNTYVVEDFYQYPKTNFLEAEIPCTGFRNFKVTLIIKKQTVFTYFDNECTLKMFADY